MQKVTNKIDNMGYREAMDREMSSFYDEACKDSIFNELVSKTKLSKDVLMKYTSTLQSCSVEYGNCKGCKGLVECKNSLYGYCFLPRVSNKKIIFENKACRYMKKKLDDMSYMKNIYTFSVSSDVLDASINDVHMNDKKRFEAIEWIHKFLTEYPKNPKQKGLYLNGSFGCGKSYLVSALFRELAKDGVKSAIIFWPEFLRDLKSSFGSDFKEKYEYVKKVPLLLIDDIGAENMTEWNRDEIFCPIIQYRMQASLPTFFTSNFTIEELEMHFSMNKNGNDVVKARRVIERIKQLTENITMISKNLR